jgi:hypothetical protein
LGRGARLAGFFELDGQGFRGAILEDNGEESGPDGNGSLAAAPFVHLTRCDAGEPSERRLGDS